MPLSRTSSQKPRAVYLLDTRAHQDVYGPRERSELAKLVAISSEALTRDSWRQAAGILSDVEAIYSGWGAPVFDAGFLDSFPSLKIVFHGAGSIKPHVTEEFWDRGLRITSATQANAIPVAEFTLSQIIFSLKHGWRAAFATRAARRFVRRDDFVPSVYGSTVGLISLGHAGRLVAQRLAALEVDVVAFDPFVSVTEAAALGVELCSLPDLFRRSDVISCHTPLLPETQQLLREAHFEAMKAGATFINTARGSIVHERELIAVLQRRPEIFAVLDVTDPEPPEENSPLFSLPNVVVTPHIAGSIGPECRRMGRMMVEETKRYLTGSELVGELRRQQLPLLA